MFARLKNISRSQTFMILGSTIGVFFFGSYTQNSYLKQRKGIRKMAQIYLRDTVGKDNIVRKIELKNQFEIGSEMELYHASVIQYFQPYFQHPYALIFPKRMESVQKILKIANKYNIAIVNQDLNELCDFQKEPQLAIIDQDDASYLEFYSNKPFIVINQKNIDYLELETDNNTCKIGAGCTLEQINQYLNERGYELPVEAPKETRLFTLLNDNEAIVNLYGYRNLGSAVKNITAILPNGQALITVPNSERPQFSYGIDYSNLFIGQNANNGLIVDATIKVQPIVKKEQSIISLNLDYVTQSSLNYIFKGLYEFLDSSQFKIHKCLLDYDKQTQSLDLLVQAEQKINLQNLLNTYVTEYVQKDLWNQQIVQNQQKKYQPNYLVFSLDRKGIYSLLYNINRLPHLKILTELDLQVELTKNLLVVGFDANNYTDLTYLRSIAAYVRYQNGRLVSCDNRQINEILKQEALPEECGLNHTFLTNNIKKWLDPKDILINRNFQNIDTQPLYE